MASTFKRILVGKPLASSEQDHQALGKPTALAVFASDAISSTAYATEEILFVLLAAATFPQTHKYLIPMALVSVFLLAVVSTSYRQTIFAYPNGGGAYEVSRENISQNAALVAGASLLVDYTLTVAVSVSSGVLAIGSAFHFNDQSTLRVALALGFVALMAIGNLRGLKEAGRVFAVPTYAYTLLLGGLIAYGIYKIGFQDLGTIPGNEKIAEDFAKEQGAELSKLTGSVGLLLLLRAFSSGAVVLAGVEAMSNGVPAFRQPKSKNASQTLMMMAFIMGVSTLGVSYLASHLHPVFQEGGDTVLSQMGGAIFGDGTFLYYALQFATFGILILAANTAFAGFPQLSSNIARDGFLPRQLANRGDRLVFSNGVLILSGMAALLIVIFKADVSALIPLYAVGVFVGFTLSQFGMCRHHLRLREPKWQTSLFINGLGCFMTGVVLVVVIVSKFTEGAWIPVVIIPAIVALLKVINRHYRSMDELMTVEPHEKVRRRTNTVIVLVGRVTRGSLTAIAYARSLNPDRLVAVTVVSNPEEQESIGRQWEDHQIPVELVSLYSPYRELSRPIMRYIDDLDDQFDDDFVTVVVPEFTLEHWWQQLLHNQSALVLRTRLRNRPNTVVTSVPFNVDRGRAALVAARVAAEGSHPVPPPTNSPSSEEQP
ncbi:APC family permease [Aquihabitans sp. G128]|uniref:APC family permease n=1 Tax=Aquihabitans sp. G128 TaxID=2849779 RepID=UPI001C240F82|nr:APC family permease [Aquihabitans sp. G128]QXC59702.1 APC family permease [Aquihabitans sp. G128]